MSNFSQEYLLQVFEWQAKRNHRTIYVLVGDGSKYQIPVLHERLSKITNLNNIIWMYKNAETYMDREAKKVKVNEEDSDFFKWIKTEDPNYISYKEHSKILGQTCNMLILQDFEALTPNIMACSMETVCGGGTIVLLLDQEKSINEIISKNSDLVDALCVDAKSIPRFNRRIFRSLMELECAVFLDSKLRVLNITNEMKFTSVNVEKKLFEKPEHPLLSQCRTEDQLNTVKELINCVELNQACIITILASRGRGKSVALGLSIAEAIHKNIPNIIISSLFLDNVQEIFRFVIQGLNKLDYKKNKDYKIIYSFEAKKRLIQKIEIIKQTTNLVEYCHPLDDIKYHPGLMVIDEAAAIPLPELQPLLKYRLVFMASTANGYEGTGRIFRTKLKQYLFDNFSKQMELSMTEPIRYAASDMIEKWLYDVLLLEPKVEIIQECPLPADCALFHVNKDALFSGNKKSELFLNELFSLFVASHYRNSPNDIQILSDSPNHEIFILLTSSHKIVCAVQLAFEGGKTKFSINKEGNLIPSVIYDTFRFEQFLAIKGARIVRIATHPSYLSMGYGSFTVKSLIDHFILSSQNCKKQLSTLTSLADVNKQTLLHLVTKIQLPEIEWLGSSWGLTEKLLNFWKKLDFTPVCIKQTQSKTTGEYSTVAIRNLSNVPDLERIRSLYLQRFIGLLPGPFRDLHPSLVLSLIYSSNSLVEDKLITFTYDERERLWNFGQGIIDIKNITDVLPDVMKFYFYKKDINKISLVAQAALIVIGCQCKQADVACKILDIEYFKLIGILANAVRVLIMTYDVFKL